MSAWSLVAVVLSLAALFAYLNERLVRLPQSIGIMVLALVFSLGLQLLPGLGVDAAAEVKGLMDRVRFDVTVLHGLLGFLLFAGALSVDWNALRRNGVMVAVLATLGVVISTLVVAMAMHEVLAWLGKPLSWAYCLLFGALISPTDPIAVLGLLKRLGVDESLEMTVAGESLFNDGVAVTLFLLLLPLVHTGAPPDLGEGLMLLAREALGGVAFGAVTGWLTLWLLRSVDQYALEILLTLALASGGFTLADWLGVSAPLAIVVAGLMIGHRGKRAMSERTAHHLGLFWHLVDEILNAVLFLLLGLEVVMLNLQLGYLGAMAAAIPVVLAARWLSVGLPFALLPGRGPNVENAVAILVWGGVRGGLSVAMALALPAGDARGLLVALTYGVVLFALLVQGTTVVRLVSRSRAQS